MNVTDENCRNKKVTTKAIKKLIDDRGILAKDFFLNGVTDDGQLKLKDFGVYELVANIYKPDKAVERKHILQFSEI